MFWSNPKSKRAAEAAKHPTTTTTTPANIISSAPLQQLKEMTPHRASQQQRIAEQMNVTSQKKLSPTWRAVAEQASLMALALGQVSKMSSPP
jgi:hypothetical protein